MTKEAKPDAWMPLYIGPYLRKTNRLTTEQHGAYLLLLIDYWVNGPPPDDDDELSSITRLGSTWKKHRAKILAFFTLVDGRWHQDRADVELERAAKVSEARREAGRQGGRPKKQKESYQKPNGSENDAFEKAKRKQNETPLHTELEASSKASNISERERSEARLDGASGFRVIDGGEAEAWRQALAEARHDLPHFERTDPDYASEIAEFIDVAIARLESMVVAA